jgi:hypothetical protein
MARPQCDTPLVMINMDRCIEKKGRRKMKRKSNMKSNCKK